MEALTRQKEQKKLQPERLTLKKWYKQFKLLAEQAGVPQVVSPCRNDYKRPWKKGIKPIDALDEVLEYAARLKVKREAEDAVIESAHARGENTNALMQIVGALSGRL